MWSHDDDDDDDGVIGCPGKNKNSSRLVTCADRNFPAFSFRGTTQAAGHKVFLIAIRRLLRII